MKLRAGDLTHKHVGWFYDSDSHHNASFIRSYEMGKDRVIIRYGLADSDILSPETKIHVFPESDTPPPRGGSGQSSTSESQEKPVLTEEQIKLVHSALDLAVTIFNTNKNNTLAQTIKDLLK